MPGRRYVHASRGEMAELAGDVPQERRPDTFVGYHAPSPRTTHSVQVSASTKPTGRINLRAVAEACIEEGLDPATEIARALTKTRPKVVDGQVVLDEHGVPVQVPVLDEETRLRTLTELLQYVQPKLKSVEVKLDGRLDLSSEQIDQRLQALLAKAALPGPAA